MKLLKLKESFPIYSDRLGIKVLSSRFIGWYVNETHRDYFTEFSDNKSVKYMPKIKIKTRLLSLISTYNTNINFVYEFRTVIVDKYLDIPVGGITLFPIKLNTLELGYWVSPEYQNKGYANEAINTLINHIFNIFGANELSGITLCIQSINSKSIRLAEKQGFKLRDKTIGKEHTNLIYKLDREQVEN